MVPSFRGQITDVRALPDGDPSLPEGPDLVKMAKAALGYLFRNPVRSRDCQCRFSFYLLNCPPFTPLIPPTEELPDPVALGDTESRNDIAFNQMREMTGSCAGIEVQEAVHRRLVGYLRSGAGKRGDDMCWLVAYSVLSPEYYDAPYAMQWATAKLLQSETDLFRLTGDAPHRDLARRVFEGLRRMADWDTGRAFYPDGARPWREGKIFSPGSYEGFYPHVIGPCAMYGLACQDQEALEFAAAMAEGIVSDVQPGHHHRPDGRVFGHSHGQMHAVRHVAQLGALTNNWRMIDWAWRAYDFYRGIALDTGWLPEIAWSPDHDNHSETCLVADMTEMEAYFALAGRPDFWDNVDRTVRNYLVPAQFRLTDDVEAFWLRAVGAGPAAAAGPSPGDVREGLELLRDLDGGFLSALTPNDRVFEARAGGNVRGLEAFEGRRLVMDMMGCCPPEGMRMLYIAWTNVLQRTPGGVLVNLFFDRDDPLASVASDIPRLGRIRVKPKVEADFWLRPPSWAPRADVALLRNGTPAEARWGGPAYAYVAFKEARPGETLELRWPLVSFNQSVAARRLESEESSTPVEGTTYKYRWTGSTVTSVTPRGEWLPLYG